MFEMLKNLTALSGACGFEHDVAKYIVECVRPWADEVEVDGVGNVIVTKRGASEGPRVVVSTHMDEVGFIVKKIEENGLIRFEKLGGHDDRILPAQRIRILTSLGVVEGVIGTISIHMMRFEDATRVRQHSELYIDVGAKNKAEALELGVSIGDPITWATELQRVGKRRVMGKSFDDRTGCVVVLKSLQELSASDIQGTLTAVFSVQEEVGLRGARVAGHQIKADVAIAIDTTAVSDTPESVMDSTLSLGDGPCIKVMDFSLVASKRVRDSLVEVAKAQSIPYQMEVFTGIGTDGGELSLSNGGVPTGVISIPSRYTHSPVEFVDLDDLENTKNLFKSFIKSLSSDSHFRFI